MSGDKAQGLAVVPGRNSTKREVVTQETGFTVKREEKTALIEQKALTRWGVCTEFEPRIPLKIPQPRNNFEAVITDIIRHLPAFNAVQRERAKEIETERKEFYEKRKEEERVKQDKFKLLRKVLKNQFRPFINGEQVEWDSVKDFPSVNLLDSTVRSVKLPDELTEESAIKAIKESEQGKTHTLGPSQELIVTNYSAHVENLSKKPPAKQVSWEVRKI